MPERHSAEAAAVLAGLARFRRRAIGVAALRHAIAAVLGFLIVVPLTAVAAGAPLTAATVAAGLCLAAAAGGAVAVVRAPTVRETAMIVDRRLGLENRAAAALQFVRAHDPVAALVVRDGAVRLARHRPADAFPLEYPRHARVLATGVACAALLVVGSQLRPSSSASLETGGSGLGGAQASADSREAITARAEPSGRSVRQGPGLQRPVGVRGAEHRQAGTVSSEPGGSRLGSSSPTPRPSADASGDASAPPGERPPSAGSTTGRAGASGSDGASTGEARSAAAGPAIGAAAGGGTVTGEVAARGGGLVAAAPRTDAATRAGNAAVQRSPVDSARYRADWQRGQAAIAHARIPPGLRHYVRAYFAAIRSPEQP